MRSDSGGRPYPASARRGAPPQGGAPGGASVPGGTDVLVELNFDRARPAALINLNEVAELRGGPRERRASARRRPHLRGGDGGGARRGCCRRSRRPRARSARRRSATAARSGGNLGTASPAGDALPPLLVAGAEVCFASVRGSARVPLGEFLVGAKRNALEPDELVAAVRVDARGAAADVHEGRAPQRDGDRGLLARRLVDRERDELRARLRLCGPRPVLVTLPDRRGRRLPRRVAEAASPIDDVRGTPPTAVTRCACSTARALERCFA